MTPTRTAAASGNFTFLLRDEPQLTRLATLAERYFHDDPSTTLIKVRQFAETLARVVAARNGVLEDGRANFDGVLRALQEARRMPRETADLFHALRRAGNAAAHEAAGTHGQALAALKLARQLGVWFRRSYGGEPAFAPGPFMPPVAPADASGALREEIEELRGRLDAETRRAEQAAEEALRREQALEGADDRAEREAGEARFWREYAETVERDGAALNARVAELQAAAVAAPPSRAAVEQAEAAAQGIVVDEADTRALIDVQLAAAGWEADTTTLRWSEGARPEVGRRLAIAEWPCEKGRADYALFIDERCVGVVEAKRKAADVSGALAQAERYARTLQLRTDQYARGAPYADGDGGSARVPFAFATNGRPYLKQLEARSGVWFRDLRRPTHRAAALPEWFTPEDLDEKLRQELDPPSASGVEEAFGEVGIRPYQFEAVTAVERAIDAGHREVLVAMATGTGKTRTCLALMYRLLRRRRFRRILFLVDREALGRQTLDALNTTEVEGLLKFAQAYPVAGLDAREPGDADRVHVATVQSLVRRLSGEDDRRRPSPGRYDLVVVDEAHRGYVLDAEMRESDLEWRSPEDYLSRYRRVLDHFDAVKVGLTATPALHTTQIFGDPVFSYGYRQAVVDGWLVDHLPARRIRTELSEGGISFDAGSAIDRFDPRTGELDLFHTPDQLDFDVAAFNRMVETQAFNRVVAQAVATEIPPSEPGKTLIFATRDSHADMLVAELSAALEREYGPQPADLVQKITGSVDQPLQRIKRFQNDPRPNYVVTVDLLTTGIDVPPISNLVFARRVNSRILYDQMIGRATRLYPGKTAFRIFDAVDLYSRLAPVTEMKPVVVDPGLTFQQLAEDLARAPTEEDRRFVRDQLIVKLRGRLQRLGPESEAAVADAAGRPGADLLGHLQVAPADEAARLFAERPQLARALDAGVPTRDPARAGVLISTHEDALVAVEDVFTGAASPEDYITAFERFVRENINRTPALVAVVQRPRELTRRELTELAVLLDAKGFSAAELKRAYARARNADIAAHVAGFVRQAALGDPLVPYAARVDGAVERLLASRTWTPKQAQWLRRIGRAIREAAPVGDPALLDAPVFQNQGGWPAVDADFDGRLAEVLGDLNEAIWPPGQARAG